ncbi:MAG: hypothetical protein AMXMBFR84_07710 [Candidatus Hydrogenedentota bacterium]
MAAAQDRSGNPPQGHQFEEVIERASPPTEHLRVDDLKDVRLTMSAALGFRVMKVREILELRRGSIVQLNKLAGEMTDIYVNGLHLARGEVVVIGDMLHVRIGEIVGQEDKGGEMDLLDGDGS